MTTKPVDDAKLLKDYLELPRPEYVSDTSERVDAAIYSVLQQLAAMTTERDMIAELLESQKAHGAMQAIESLDTLCALETERDTLREQLADKTREMKLRVGGIQRECAEYRLAIETVANVPPLTADQVEELTRYMADYFGRGVKGCWFDLATAIAAALKSNAALRERVAVLVKSCESAWHAWNDKRTRPEEVRDAMIAMESALSDYQALIPTTEAPHATE